MKKADTNTIVAIAALVTSVAAVFIAWEESRLMRKSQAATFMPILEVRPSFSMAPDDLRLEFAIRNSGHGVAYIEYADVRYDGVSLPTYEAFVSTVLTKDLGRDADFGWHSMTGYLLTGEETPVLVFRWEDNPENRERLSTFLTDNIADRTEKMAIVLCYCSVFDECWEQSFLGSAKPEPVRKCGRGADPSDLYFQTKPTSYDIT